MNWLRRMVIPSAGATVVNVVRRIVVGIAGVVVVALAMELAAPKAVRAVSNLFVTVTNTPNVNVVNTPSVNVASLPAVTVSSLPAVQVGSISGNVPVANPLDTNGSPIPLVTQNPLSGGNAFDVNGTCGFSVTACDSSLYTIPAGKLAVIQSATGSCFLDNSTTIQQVAVGYITQSGDAGFSFPIVGPAVTSGGVVVQQFGGRMTAYASSVVTKDPSSDKIGIDVAATDSESSVSGCRFEVAGYLVNQ